MQKVIIQYAFFCLYLNCRCAWSARFRYPSLAPLIWPAQHDSNVRPTP